MFLYQVNLVCFFIYISTLKIVKFSDFKSSSFKIYVTIYSREIGPLVTRRICCSYNQNLENNFKLLISLSKDNWLEFSCRYWTTVDEKYYENLTNCWLRRGKTWITIHGKFNGSNIHVHFVFNYFFLQS